LIRVIVAVMIVLGLGMPAMGIAENKSSWASEYLATYEPSKANDNDYATAWLAESPTAPVYWAVDLGEIYNISTITAYQFSFGNYLVATYNITSSLDNITYAERKATANADHYSTRRAYRLG